MTTSSDNRTPSAPRPEAKNWSEVSSRLLPAATEKFAEWLDAKLEELEKSQKRFITSRSLAKSLRR